VLLLQSGRPYSVLVTKRDYNNDAAFVDKPDAPSQKFGGWSRSDYIKGTFKASDFPAPPPGREGNLGRSAYRGSLCKPGLQPDLEHADPLVHSRAGADAASGRGVQSDESRQHQQLGH